MSIFGVKKEVKKIPDPQVSALVENTQKQGPIAEFEPPIRTVEPDLICGPNRDGPFSEVIYMSPELKAMGRRVSHTTHYATLHDGVYFVEPTRLKNITPRCDVTSQENT